jgi:hypothetical protein
MTGLALLLHRGPGGLPPAVPVDFESLVLPASPNTCLAGPPDYRGPKHLTRPPFPVPPDRLWAVLNRMAAGFPRTWKLAEWPHPGGAPGSGGSQAQWVERTRWMNFPDIIAAEVRPAAEGAALLLYSRSLIGWSDLGVNRARVERWLAAIDAALKD